MNIILCCFVNLMKILNRKYKYGIPFFQNSVVNCLVFDSFFFYYSYLHSYYMEFDPERYDSYMLRNDFKLYMDRKIFQSMLVSFHFSEFIACFPAVPSRLMYFEDRKFFISYFSKNLSSYLDNVFYIRYDLENILESFRYQSFQNFVRFFVNRYAFSYIFNHLSIPYYYKITMNDFVRYKELMAIFLNIDFNTKD